MICSIGVLFRSSAPSKARRRQLRIARAAGHPAVPILGAEQSPAPPAASASSFFRRLVPILGAEQSPAPPHHLRIMRLHPTRSDPRRRAKPGAAGAILHHITNLGKFRSSAPSKARRRSSVASLTERASMFRSSAPSKARRRQILSDGHWHNWQVPILGAEQSPAPPNPVRRTLAQLAGFRSSAPSKARRRPRTCSHDRPRSPGSDPRRRAKPGAAEQ